MARLLPARHPSGHTILIVDDDQAIRDSLKRLLEQDGHTVSTASSGAEALKMCHAEDYHLILLDYFMHRMNGDEVVRRLREFNTRTQVVLQTGYASEKPARQLLRELDIQGFHDKSEGPEKLLIWVDASLKAYRAARALKASHDGLQHILHATSSFNKIQPLTELLTGILMQIKGLLGFSSAMLATQIEQPPGSDSALIAFGHHQEFVVRVGIGRFQGQRWDTLSADEQALIQQTASDNRLTTASHTAIPMSVGNVNTGVILIDRPFGPDVDLSLLQLLGAHAASAIDNSRLYALATTDPLTGLSNKAPWRERLSQDLDRATRYHVPTSVLMIDLDHFKSVNDRHGHLAGDAVLRAVGGVMLDTARSPDLPGRYGGEEFVLLLPHTDLNGALIVAERLRERIQALKTEYDQQVILVTVSIGVASAEANPEGQISLDHLLAQADRALYAAKLAGRNQVITAATAEGHAAPLSAPAR